MTFSYRFPYSFYSSCKASLEVTKLFCISHCFLFLKHYFLPLPQWTSLALTPKDSREQKCVCHQCCFEASCFCAVFMCLRNPWICSSCICCSMSQLQPLSFFVKSHCTFLSMYLLIVRKNH